MAISVDKVYKTVLYVLNKEQRGYITPQEFNSLAEQAQDEIFNSYFPDGNQQNRKNQTNSQNDTEFFNIYKDIAYKLFPFEKETSFSYDSTNDGWYYNGSNTIYKLGEIISTYSSSNPTIESITQLTSKSDYSKITRSNLTSPNSNYPICYTTITTTAISPATENELLIKISPKPSSVSINCLFKPSSPNWAFTTGSLGQYIYNPSSSIDFDLDISEQTNVIINILKYCGIIVRDPQVVQAAEQQSQKVEINEKS